LAWFESTTTKSGTDDAVGAVHTIIPGHREAMSAESITHREYGFGAWAKKRIPEMTNA
jgi:hypothetical protein